MVSLALFACKASPGEDVVSQVVIGPRISCDEPEYNFGTVAQGEDARHVFTVRNVGDAPLKIESARGG